ncbi:hypothetical protein [Ruficoccus sp. ZRK36]|uniref:hypothetical protein n=1 Tax=Ruficoccus sp. ZRK36 TaxID=2866311 RepID=UPI001C73308B|nr:hypothetical protein [Ruficoccus sp. ZRK36]QYY37397.1 hypothetical protein K0V07_07895 [Ruficoccus sp. ZRK36]
MPSAPAILIPHQGDSFYISHTIAQARQSNPDSRLILLGDDINRYYKGVEHYAYSDYFQTAREIGELYRHRNPVPRHAEWLRFCFQKWAFMRDFIKAHELESCFIIDTDVLIFGDLVELRTELAPWGLTVSRAQTGLITATGALSLLQDVTLLDQMVDIMREMFEPSSLSRELDEDYLKHGGDSNPHNPAAVTEMIAIGLLYERNRDRVLNTCPSEYRGQQAIDHNMGVETGWEMQDGLVRLYWENGRPYGLWLEDGEKIPFLGLHCGGKAKWQMKDWVRLSDPAIVRDWKRNRRSFTLHKYARKLRKKLPF